MKDLKEILEKDHAHTNGYAAADYGMMIPEVGQILSGGGMESKVTDIATSDDGVATITIANGQKIEAKQLAGLIADGKITTGDEQ